MPKTVEELSDQEIRDYKREFDALDTDKSGKISIKELPGLLSKYGLKISPAKAQQAADIDDDGQIDFSEFLIYVVEG